MKFKRAPTFVHQLSVTRAIVHAKWKILSGRRAKTAGFLLLSAAAYVTGSCEQGASRSRRVPVRAFGYSLESPARWLLIGLSRFRINHFSWRTRLAETSQLRVSGRA